MPEKVAAETRAKVHHPVDGERIDVERSSLNPGGVIGDEDERAETDLAAHNQFVGGNRDDENWKNRNFTRKSLRRLPQGGHQLLWI